MTTRYCPARAGITSLMTSVAVAAPETIPPAPVAVESARFSHSPVFGLSHCHWNASASPVALTLNVAVPCGGSALTERGCPFGAMANVGTDTESVAPALVTARPNLSVTTTR